MIGLQKKILFLDFVSSFANILTFQYPNYYTCTGEASEAMIASVYICSKQGLTELSCMSLESPFFYIKILISFLT